MLRRARAAQALKLKSGDEDAQTLRRRFEAAIAHQEAGHEREWAYFYLYIQPDASRALRYAQMNWQQQHEPIDAHLLLQAASAAKQPQAAQVVLQWQRDNQVEDVTFNTLAASFK